MLGGNGNPPLADRIGQVQQEMGQVNQGLSEKIANLSTEITVLKTVREIGARLFWSGIGVVGTISGGVVGILVNWWLGEGK